MSLRLAEFDFTVVSVPYTHRENTAKVNRDGVTDIIVKFTTDTGLVGWGETLDRVRAESPDGGPT